MAKLIEKGLGKKGNVEIYHKASALTGDFHYLVVAKSVSGYPVSRLTKGFAEKEAAKGYAKKI